ncbi:MAG: Hsp20 family protein [Holosporaceae bacterium]|jgi:HSP20 family molecular chaperone IbpA|nr:Hsp20 family protein [Holosporaceae bacterium]
MDRLSLFSSPLFLGFDHFERLVDSLSKAQEDSYPPYNIEQIGECGFRITLALAGFKKENIKISQENNQLTIKGKQETDPNAVYVYRGIASRQFAKTFVLADGVEVKSADFDNGLLHLNLLRKRNEGNVRTIEIDSPMSITESKQIESCRSSVKTQEL